MRRFFLVISYLFLSACFAAGRQFYAKVPELESISNSTVYAITQDSKGAIWLGTSYGICRYNGVELQSISKDITLHHFANCPERNAIFYQCEGSLLEIDAKQYSRQQLSTTAIRSNIYSTAVFGSYAVACDNHTLFIEDCDTLKRWISVPAEYGKPRLLQTTVSGRLFCATNEGKLLEIINDRIFLRADMGDEICGIFEDSHFRLWIGLNSAGITVFSHDFISRSEFHPTVHLKPARKFRAFTEDIEGNMFAGCLDGLFNISTDGKCNISNAYSPDGFAICSLFRDAGDNIWIGTFYGGVFLCEKNVSPFTTIEISPFSQPRISTGLIEDSRGDIWLVTDKSGMYHFPKSGEAAVAIPGSEDMKIKNAWYDTDEDAIWVSRYLQPFSKYDIRSGRWSHYNYASSKGVKNSTSGFHIIKVGDDFWIAGSERIFLFNASTEKEISRTLPDYKGHPRNLRLQSDGSVLICGNGLSKWKNGEVRHISDLDGSICFDAILDGDRIWTGTNSGLYLCDSLGNVTKHFDKKNTGLGDNFVYAILPLNDGMLLLGTNSGVSFFNTQKAECYNYSPRNGLGLSSVQEGCILQKTDGTVWIAGTDGLSRFDPSDYRIPKSHPKIDIDKMLVNGKEIPINGKISLSHKENNLFFKTSTYDYAGIVTAFCQCRLLPYEKEWENFNIKTPIAYLGLKSGKYTLEFRIVPNLVGSDDCGCSKIDFRIRHPWYWSPISWIIYIIILFLYIRWQASMLSESRARKRVRNAKDVSIVAQNDSDTALIRQTEKTIMDHISDTSLSVETLCHELGMSYQVLASRIKELTGYSPRDFIEFIRMRKASMLLLEKDMNVSAVAFEVGFNSSQYFATRFKKHFGLTPSEYILSMSKQK